MFDLKDYTVHWVSKPGMCARYQGVKRVAARDEEHALKMAWRLLRSDFPDRTRDMFRFEAGEDNEVR